MVLHDNSNSSSKGNCPTCVEFKNITNNHMFDQLKKNCPLDKNELGKNTWSFLHTMAANYPENPSKETQEKMSQFVNLFSEFFPCSYCAQHLRKQLKTSEDVIDTSSRHGLSQWFCRLHNEVNLRLGKPMFDCKDVDFRWKNGWPDGRCDKLK